MTTQGSHPSPVAQIKSLEEVEDHEVTISSEGNALSNPRYKVIEVAPDPAIIIMATQVGSKVKPFDPKTNPFFFFLYAISEESS